MVGTGAGAGDVAAVGRRVVEEGLVERGGEVLEVEDGDEGDEGERERVRGQERGPPPVPVAAAAAGGRPVLRLHHPLPPSSSPTSIDRALPRLLDCCSL